MTRVYGFPLRPGLVKWARERCNQPRLDLFHSIMELLHSTGSYFSLDDWRIVDIVSKRYPKNGQLFLSLRTAVWHGKTQCAIDEARVAQIQAALEELYGIEAGEYKPRWYKELD
ncbi:hypothetical protein DFH06DRAFT_1127555 [Mycena polygramma]|nr:hypothetical protein DFH06DRAFT_1127555 [Mycena polygramma]